MFSFNVGHTTPMMHQIIKNELNLLSLICKCYLCCYVNDCQNGNAKLIKVNLKSFYTVLNKKCVCACVVYVYCYIRCMCGFVSTVD